MAAFHEPSAEADPWTRLARVAAACLEYQGVSCRACGDACEAGAIRFNLHAGGQSLPRIAADTCTGCGACVSVCPVLAITVE